MKQLSEKTSEINTRRIIYQKEKLKKIALDVCL